MRAIIILVLALTFGLAGGYAWSAMTAPAPRAAKPGIAGFAPLPASPEERPEALDQEWTSRADDKGAAVTTPTDRPTAERRSSPSRLRALA